MTRVFSWQNSMRLCPASFCTPMPNLPVTPGLLIFYFCISVPSDEKNIFFWYQFQKVLQVFIDPFNFSFFGISGWGIDLDYCNTEWFALETSTDHSVIFEIASKYCILDPFLDYEDYSISSKGFLPTVVDIKVM